MGQLSQRSSGVFGPYAISWQLWLLVAPLGIAGSASLVLDANVDSVASHFDESLTDIPIANNAKT